MGILNPAPVSPALAELAHLGFVLETLMICINWAPANRKLSEATQLKNVSL